MADQFLDNIKNPMSRPVRELYLKRRLYVEGAPSATFEPDFFRVDNFPNRDIVLNWGSISNQLNTNPAQIDEYNVPSMRIVVDDADGLFGNEIHDRSLWYNQFAYIRKFSKIKIKTGYDIISDSKWDKVNWDEFNWDSESIEDTFDGLINRITVSDDNRASIEVIGYAVILQKYNIADLILPFTITAKFLVETILSQPKIRAFIGYNPTDPSLDYVINTSELSGTYWDVIKEIAFKSNSVPIFEGESMTFRAREANPEIAFNYKGRGSSDKEVTLKRITKYDEGGEGRVRVFWKDADSDLSVRSTNDFLLTRYLDDPEEIAMTDVTTDADKERILINNLREWEQPKPTIEFISKPVIDKVKLLDRISIENASQEPNGPKDNLIWTDGNWDEKNWAATLGGINISSSENWRVTGIVKDIDRWEDRITAEKIVT